MKLRTYIEEQSNNLFKSIGEVDELASKLQNEAENIELRLESIHNTIEAVKSEKLVEEVSFFVLFDSFDIFREFRTLLKHKMRQKYNR